MRIYKYLIVIFMFAAVACNTEEPLTNMYEADYDMAEIECVIGNQYTPTSRTHYEDDNTDHIYCAKWDQGDQLAVCFDGFETARCFKLLKGSGSSSATFYGPVPDTFNKIFAVYPFDIYTGQTPNSVKVCIPSVITYNAQKILCEAMPMFAKGNAGALNFYNLMSVLKVSVKGHGLLKSISIRSTDGYGLSGNGFIALDENNIPKLSFEENNTDIKINIGSLFLSENAADIFLPIPATEYEHGLKLEF